MEDQDKIEPEYGFRLYELLTDLIEDMLDRSDENKITPKENVDKELLQLAIQLHRRVTVGLRQSCGHGE